MRLLYIPSLTSRFARGLILISVSSSFLFCLSIHPCLGLLVLPVPVSLHGAAVSVFCAGPQAAVWSVSRACLRGPVTAALTSFWWWISLWYLVFSLALDVAALPLCLTLSIQGLPSKFVTCLAMQCRNSLTESHREQTSTKLKIKDSTKQRSR